MAGRHDGTTAGTRAAATTPGSARLLATLLLAASTVPASARAQTPIAAPAAVSLPAASPDAARPQSIAVDSFRGNGRLPVLGSRDLETAQPDIVRAVITIHGRDRDAASYDRIARDGLARAGAAGIGTLLLTPRFADDGDPDLARDTLRWHGNDWMEGGLADGPAALGSFEALDAILARLSDRKLFPALRTIVLAGHSGGAQLVQRYAVLGHMPKLLTAKGLQVRFLVANPSSYSYFTADRPTQDGGFAPFPLDQCHRFDDWKYGMHALPDYADGASGAVLEQDYVQRDVTYLLGTADTDPSLDALDRSCAAEAQGPNHLIRGRDFVRYLRLRHPIGLNQYEYDIAGVGHDAQAMLTSDCALATIYDAPLCGHVPPPVAARTTAPALTLPHAPRRPRPAPPMHVVRPLPPPPPPPRRHPVEHAAAAQPGWDWQPGGWNWNGEAYVWMPGRRVRRSVPQPVFMPPLWQFDGAGWVWVPAHWRNAR